MDKLFRDVYRLGLIASLDIGCERFSVVTHFKDFGSYFFSRFLVNLQHSFKDFAGSEIQDFNRKHQAKLERITKYPALYHGKEIVPIPKGMVHSYKDTLDQLIVISTSAHADTLGRDLQALSDLLGTGKISTLVIDDFTKEQFEAAKVALGKLFGVTGLTHSTASHVLAQPSDIGYVNSTLLSTTATHYQMMLSLHPLLKKVETKFHQFKYTEHEKELLQAAFMTLAYRLSIVAVIADQLQGVEHGFVGAVDILFKGNHL